MNKAMQQDEADVEIRRAIRRGYVTVRAWAEGDTAYIEVQSREQPRFTLEGPQAGLADMLADLYASLTVEGRTPLVLVADSAPPEVIAWVQCQYLQQTNAGGNA